MQPADTSESAATILSQRDARMQSLEAVLFLSSEPLNTRKLSQYANLADGTEALTLIRQLNRLYEAEGRAFRVEQVAGGHQLMTHPALADWLRRLAGTPAEVRLSTPAMETLAVVAYRQPVGRAQVEAIRGVACGEMLRQLMDRDLVRIAGRSDELGRPFLYGTTNRFLHIFGLGSIDELPRAEALRAPLTGERPQGESGEESSATNPQAELVAAAADLAERETKESDQVTLTIDMPREDILDPAAPHGKSGPLEQGESAPVVADVDEDDDLEDDWDDDEDDDYDDDEFDDDFDDDFEDEDDEWDDDEFDDDELDADDDLEEDDEWEEVEDDEDVDDEEDDEDDWDDEDDED